MYNHVIVKVLDTSYVTHDVKCFVIEKPPDCNFIPGQSVNISINLPEWKEQLRPFTFTNLPDDNYLELMIKIYQNTNGVTHKLDSINAGDELILHDIFGVIQYKEKGVFIAAGSGITPFISIFRDLYKKKQIPGNMLIYSNKTEKDVILGSELLTMLGEKIINVFTRENVIGFLDRRIDRNFLIENIQDFNQHFYICGPESFVADMNKLLLALGASSEFIVIEE
jgi:ferredoxin-NADP reductase